MYCLCYLFSLYTTVSFTKSNYSDWFFFKKLWTWVTFTKWSGSESFISIFQYFPYTSRINIVSEHSDTSSNSRFCYHASGYQITLPWAILYWSHDLCFSTVLDKLEGDEKSSTNRNVSDDNDWLCTLRSFFVEKKNIVYRSCLKIPKRNALLTKIPEHQFSIDYERCN